MNASARLHVPVSPAPRASAAAVRAYLRVGVESQVAAASPHRLVALLFERLQRLTTDAMAAARAGEAGRRLAATERAIAIVEGLDATLDVERGGDVAHSLRQVYGLVRQRLLTGEAEGLAEAADAVGSIADAWRRIG